MVSAIHLKNLTKYFGDNPALLDLNLEVEPGHFVGYLGPNGAGKSTTIKLLCNLLEPDSGEIYLNGMDISKDPQGALNSVGSIVETPQFYSFLTPREHLKYFGELREMPEDELKERIVTVLEQVKLSNYIDTRIEEFSRGMNQRLAIAKCLLHEAEILLLDEPLLGLDPTGVSEMRKLFGELKDQEKTVLYSSHILSEVQRICDEVAVLREGELLEYGNIDELEDMIRLKEVEVETLSPLSQDQVEGLLEMDSVEGVESEGEITYVNYTGGKEDLADILDKIRDSGARISSFHGEKKLENLYARLTEGEDVK